MRLRFFLLTFLSFIFLGLLKINASDATDCIRLFASLPIKVEFIDDPNWTQRFGTDLVVVTTHNGGETKSDIYQRSGRGIDEFRKAHHFPEHMLDIELLLGKKVLDVGTGDGQFVRDLRANGVDAEGLDIFLRPSQVELPFMHQADIRNTGLPSASYDIIYSMVSVFSYERENIDFIRKSLFELNRILRPGGLIRISHTNERTIRKALEAIPELYMVSVRSPEEVKESAEPIFVTEWIEIKKRG